MKGAFESILTILLCLIAGTSILKECSFLKCPARIKILWVRQVLKKSFGVVVASGLLLIPENPKGWDSFTSLILLFMAAEFTNTPYD